MFRGTKVLYNTIMMDAAIIHCSLTQSCLTPCSPMDCHAPGFPILHHLPELARIHVHWVSDPNISSSVITFSSHLQSFRASGLFSNELALLIKWPKIWSFNFSISPSNEYSGLISFRMDWFDLLAVQGLSRVFSNTTLQKLQFLSVQPSLWSNSHS